MVASKTAFADSERKEIVRNYFCRHIGNDVDRVVITASASLFINAFFGAVKLLFGICFASLWFIVNAVYYLLLCASRALSIRKYGIASGMCDTGARRAKALEVYTHTGVFVCLIGVSYLLVCLCMYFLGDSTEYHGYVFYCVAVSALCKTGFATGGMIMAKRSHDPIISSLRTISLIDATFSIIVVGCAMLNMGKVYFATGISSVLGMAASVLFAVKGFMMIIAGKKHFSNTQK